MKVLQADQKKWKLDKQPYDLTPDELRMISQNFYVNMEPIKDLFHYLQAHSDKFP